MLRNSIRTWLTLYPSQTVRSQLMLWIKKNEKEHRWSRLKILLLDQRQSYLNLCKDDRGQKLLSNLKPMKLRNGKDKPLKLQIHKFLREWIQIRLYTNLLLLHRQEAWDPNLDISQACIEHRWHVPLQVNPHVCDLTQANLHSDLQALNGVHILHTPTITNGILWESQSQKIYFKIGSKEISQFQ
jgi:hypothetical protein